MNVMRFILENSSRCVELTAEHLWIVGVALVLAILIGVPAGILITRSEASARRVINAANVMMTIPSIALFGMMLPLLSLIGFGLGKLPAVVALVLYSQLPIIRNTHTAIKNVPSETVDSARGMGMSTWQRLAQVEIPLAVPVIIAGLRTAAVMNIGIAAIAAYIGAGGLGVFIQQGIARVYWEMILTGALLVSLLAVLIDALMALLERWATPAGVKLQKEQR